MSDAKKRVTASFNAQGLMQTLGAELVHVADGEVHIALWPRPELTQQHGYVHAGAITSAVDSACGYAALTLAPAEHDVLTVEFKDNFMRPAGGDRILTVGKVIKPGKTISVCQGEVIGEREGKHTSIALMQATMMLAPRSD